MLDHLADAITTAHLAQLGGSEATLRRIAGAALPAAVGLTLLLILTTIWPHETWQLTLDPHSDRHLMATAARITRWWPRHAAQLIDPELDDRGRPWRPGRHTAATLHITP